ncbi:MAG: acyltransferase [Deltaproteobacteria bacterium]
MRERSSARLANVERLRLVAMFEIVAFHVSEQRLPVVAGLGLPVFLLLNNAFNCTLAERMGTRPFLNTKVSRLLLPWLLWNVLYLALVLAERWRHEEPLSYGLSFLTLLGGTYEHLWFVPFALLGALIIAGLQAQTRALSQGWMCALGLAVGVGVTLASAWLLAPGRIEWPWLQWLFALPAVPFGFGLGRALLATDRRVRTRLAWLAAATALGCLAAGLAWGLGVVWGWPMPEEMLRRYAVSMALVSLSFVWPGVSDRFSLRLTPLLFGVYLSHPLVVRLYQATHLPELPLVIYAALVFGVSALLVALLKRSPLRFLV